MPETTWPMDDPSPVFHEGWILVHDLHLAPWCHCYGVNPSIRERHHTMTTDHDELDETSFKAALERFLMEHTSDVKGFQFVKPRVFSDFPPHIANRLVDLKIEADLKKWRKWHKRQAKLLKKKR